jgi:hypothetical protein
MEPTVIVKQSKHWNISSDINQLYYKLIWANRRLQAEDVTNNVLDKWL